MYEPLAVGLFLQNTEENKKSWEKIYPYNSIMSFSPFISFDPISLVEHLNSLIRIILFNMNCMDFSLVSE